MGGHDRKFDGKVIFVTGGTGSWGTQLVTHLLANHNPKEVRVYSRGEEKQVWLKRKFAGERRLKCIIGDVRDRHRLTNAMKDAHIVFHLAALKHVPVCEENPWEAVQTNIVGTQHVIDAAIENGVEKVIDVSSDKAVDPFNVYGTCKALGEKLIVTANLIDTPTRFICVRGANVLGTSGSVVPLFREQLLRTGELTLTDDRMTRFVMNLDHVSELITTAAVEGVGGEIFVMRMPSVRIVDLANVMIKALRKDASMRTIGIRPGEKLHEVMVSRYEVATTVAYGPFYVVLPNLDLPGLTKYAHEERMQGTEYASEHPPFASAKEITAMLDHEGWLAPNAATSLGQLSPDELKHFHEREGWKRRR